MKFVPCIAASASGFIVLPPQTSRALVIIRIGHADYIRACEAYRAANDLGAIPIRPSIQRLKAMMVLIDTLEAIQS